MAITINADPAPAEREVRTEDVFLAGEGPYPFAYPPMGKIHGAQLRTRALPNDQKESVLTDVMTEWLEKGFGPAAWDRLTERIEDEADPLEPEHLVYAFKGLVEAHAGRPSTSSNGASAQPWTKTGTDVPSPSGSTSSPSTPEISVT